MPYEFLDDAPPADVGFVAWGPSLDDCFRAAADATLATMLPHPETLARRARRTAHVEHTDLELALLNLLEEMVFHKDAHGLLLAADEVRVARQGETWTVDAVFSGESIDPARHDLANDVKAVTVHRLKVERTGDGWQATVVLDV